MKKTVYLYLSILISLTISSQAFTQNMPDKSIDQVSTYKYFLVDDFKNESDEMDIIDPTAGIIEALTKQDLICLNHLNQKDWPLTAINQPDSILILKPILKRSRRLYKCGKAEIHEFTHDGELIRSHLGDISGALINRQAKCEYRINNEFEFLIFKVANNFRIMRWNAFCLEQQESRKTTIRETVQITNTGITLDSLSKYLKNNKRSDFEGIYDSIDTSGARYTLGIVRSKLDDNYNIIVLNSNVDEWQEGDLKGYFRYDFIPTGFIVSWILPRTRHLVFPMGEFRGMNELAIHFKEPNLRKIKTFLKRS